MAFLPLQISIIEIFSPVCFATPGNRNARFNYSAKAEMPSDVERNEYFGSAQHKDPAMERSHIAGELLDPTGNEYR